MVEKITNIYASILEVIDFVVSRTSDSLADILTKALPLVAPVPNAVSIYYVSMSTLDYNWVQALAVAASIECMFFALTEVVLKSWELWRTDKDEYWMPLAVSVGAFVTFFLLVMGLVYTLEVSAGHSMAPLAFPVVSVVSAIALGVTRWHNRSNKAVPASRTATKRVSVPVATPIERAVAIVTQEAVSVDEKLDSIVDDEVTATKNGSRMTVTDRRSKLSQMLDGVTATTDMVAAWAKEFGASERTIWRDISTLQS